MNPPTETNLVSTPTKCKLCNHVFPGDLLRDAAILGNNPQAKIKQVEALMSPMMKHLGKEHPDAIQEAQMTGGMFAGYLMMLLFDMDAETQKKLGMDLTRWNVRRLTTRKEMHVSDERLDERLTALFDEFSIGDVERRALSATVRDQLHNQILGMMKQLRDVLMETNRYVEGQTSVQ